jgi:hypothetical protein
MEREVEMTFADDRKFRTGAPSRGLLDQLTRRRYYWESREPNVTAAMVLPLFEMAP